MPAYERLPVTVTLIVTVDGNTLSFVETEEAKGARDWVQRDKTYSDDETLEAQIRLVAMIAMKSASRRASAALKGLYPVPPRDSGS